VQARALIEPPVAALTASARSEADLEQLEGQLDRAAELIASGDHERLAATNMDFHRTLAQASGNAVLAEVVESVTVVNVREQLAILHIHGDREADLAEHHAILTAVRAGDAVLAEQLTRAHLDGVLSAISSTERTALP
jgi:GntR family transcriptional repressor for pyruvate dehydrogenase complex